ncbi:NADPH-dependent conjugated polyketone reductase C2 [[Candida] anglica]
MTKIDSSKPKLTTNFKTKSGIPITLGTGTGTKWKDLKRSDPQNQDGLDAIVQSLVDALESGYNHIDTAEAYTTHPEVARAIAQTGKNREDLWITTKYSPGSKNFPPSSKGPLDFLDKALKELETEYIDLLLIHHPFLTPDHSVGYTIETAWQELEEAKKSGKVREIGVSNFRKIDLEKIAKISTITPAVNQIEFHAYLQDQSPDIVKYSQDNGILIEAFGPLSPIFRIKDEKTGEEITDHPLTKVLPELSTKYNKTDAQILLRYTLQKGILPITTSSKKDRIQQTLQVYEFELDQEDFDRIDQEGAKFHNRAYFNGAF